MSALYGASQMGGDDDLGRQLAAQNVLSRTLFQEPSLQNFYQVCVYCPNGFFLTNHFERTGFQISMSDEARQTIDTLPYLPEVNADPFALHIIGPTPTPGLPAMAPASLRWCAPLPGAGGRSAISRSTAIWTCWPTSSCCTTPRG